MSYLKLFKEKVENLSKEKSFKNEDELYSFANGKFIEMVNEIEKEITIDKDDYLDGEEWYDEYQDEVIQMIFSKYNTNKLNHIMVNVFGKDGYSFMVTTSEPIIIEENILNICAEKNLFEDKDDIYSSSIETMVNENDIQFFKNNTYNID
jgi:hypothetical protein